MNFPNPFYRWRPHPWHGLDIGEDSPSVVSAFIEVTSFDAIKYEVDKLTGYMRVDRPQRSSSMPPSLYGFIPRTYCGDRIGKLSSKTDVGDGDPLDICVLSERPIDRAEVILSARVIGGLHMIDQGEADDKIISVLENDQYYKNVQEIDDLPDVLIERLRHYFGTYKLIPGQESDVYVDRVYGREEAFRVIEASVEDYKDMFGE
ncbi:inorganic pyrophosphatase [Rhodohalobacter mucosus]|uniref:Inorganic pyrophosphatase n=1 Tax=Rhodohalobacter mucosus TaxID=2079485 RepID=A0A316TTU6_9BACT|nr:inorganic pyrophosphatase [Rhodohalobacter mucosus]PWN06415.1 inorganic pyrophosphatase [Rhodohalobacter mucosus]